MSRQRGRQQSWPQRRPCHQLHHVAADRGAQRFVNLTSSPAQPPVKTKAAQRALARQALPQPAVRRDACRHARHLIIERRRLHLRPCGARRSRARRSSSPRRRSARRHALPGRCPQASPWRPLVLILVSSTAHATASPPPPVSSGAVSHGLTLRLALWDPQLASPQVSSADRHPLLPKVFEPRNVLEA